MKKVSMVTFIFVLCIGFSSCTKNGITKNAKIEYGTSKIFSEAEIKSAAKQF